MCPHSTVQQPFPGRHGHEMVPPRSALQCCGGVLVRVGRKGSIFALTLGDVAAKEQSLFS